MSLTISGRIEGAPDGRGAFSRVEAWSVGGRRRKPLASTVADEVGAFHIDFDEADLAEVGPLLGEGVVFRVLRGDEPVAETERSPVWRPERAGEEIVVPITEAEPMETRRFDGRLVDATHGSPLPGLVVRALAKGRHDGEELGSALADEQGRFTLVWPAETGRDLHLEILSETGDLLHEVDVRARDPGRVAEIRIPPAESAAGESLEDVAATPGLRIPRQLVRELSAHGVSTVGDLVEADVGELVDGDRSGLRALRRLAALSTLSTTGTENAKLVRLGYDSPAQIARASRAAFVEAAGDVLGDLRAGAVHEEASAEDAFLNTVVAGERVSVSYGMGTAIPVPGALAQAAKCSCEDCEAGVSPGAYLADLLRYSLDHVSDGGTAITLAWLGSRFHQPFRDLPASCESTQETIRQVRICIEVLRTHLSSVWATIPQPRRDALAAAEEAYRIAAYEQLLRELGTSYEEIRLARTADPEQRQSLAERLGIEPGPARPDRLDLLLLQGAALTEAMLEQRFGFKSTSSANPLAPPPPGELKDWRSEWLRSSWWASDWPTDPWSDENVQPELPIVDCDLLIERDFREPVQQNRAFTIWQTRSTWMSTRLGQLDDERRQNGLDAALGQVFGTPLPDLDTLLDNLNQGTDLAATRQTLAGLELTEDAFVRLMQIRAKDVDPNAAPTEEEWVELNSILGQAEKRKQFATWIQDERNANVQLTQEFFWLPLDPFTPPRWRGSAADRTSWADALRRRSRPPVIDPDVARPADLRDPAPGNVAYDLWAARRTWVDGRVSSFMQRPRSRTSLDAMIRSTLGLTQAPLNRLADSQRRRLDIAAQLERLTIDQNAFGYLVRIRDLISAGGQITDDEWLDVASVLTQVLKRRVFGDWRRMERLAGLVIGPDEFRFQRDPLAAPDPPRWRAGLRARRDWLEVLEARVEQEESVAEAALAAVDGAEEFALPLLRDALIEASDAPGTELPDRAKWLADRLLIDTQAAACNTTTRVAEAIETTQQLLFQLRTEQLRDVYPDLVLDADRFDEEWEWVGSYATWRAAMFVLFYPENLLIPTLRRQQTPAFRKLVGDLRVNRRLSPTRARQAAEEHAAYYQDVCSLYLEATCSGNTRVASTGRPTGDYRDLFYVFARAERSGDVYWSRHDFADPSGYAHSFWSRLEVFDGVDVYRIIGAFADEIGEDRWLWLFARVRQEGEEKLVFSRTSLEQGGEWKELEELDLPDGVTRWEAIKVQSDAPLPRLAVFTTEGGEKRFYLRQVAGSDWVEDDWTWLSLRRPGAPAGDAPSEILSAVGIYGEWGICLFARYGSTVEALFLYSGFGWGIQRNWSLGPVAKWQGAFVLGDSPGPDTDTNDPGTARIYAFWYDGFVTRYRNFGWPRTHNITAVVQSTNSLLDGPASNMAIPDGIARTPKPIAFSRQAGGPGIYVGRIDRFGVDSVLYESDRQSIAPQFPSPPDALEIFDRIRDPQRRPMLFSSVLPTIAPMFARAANRVAANRTYLEEAYYFVPVQLALQLQQRGEYVDALDWFRTVYDYGSPLFDRYGGPVNERKIYVGLREEEQYAYSFSRAADWLLDPLNPHSIAATRRNTYTRFTLLSIIRCLLEFGDSEYTSDTAETVPRARALYTTALELLSLPELDQTLGTCERIIGQLDIEVGGPEWVEVLRDLGAEIAQLGSVQLVEATVKRLNSTLGGPGAWTKRLANARSVVEEARAQVPEEPVVAAVLEEHAALETEWRASVAREPALTRALSAVGAEAAADFETAAVAVGGPILDRSRVAWLHLSDGGPNGTPEAYADRGDVGAARASYRFAGSAGTVRMLDSFAYLAGRFVPAPVYSYCVPANPVLRALRLWAELDLFKLRNCMNIAGVERELEPYAAPADTETGLPTIGAGGQLTLPGARAHRPTPYRYPTLIERAQDLVRMAAQVESSMLAAIQQGDQERYNRLKAEQDVRLAQAGVRLQDLRVREAEDGVSLAELQRQRAVIQATHYQELLDAGPTTTEEDALTLLGLTAGLHLMASILSFAATAFHITAAGIAATPLTPFTNPVTAAAESGAAASAGAAATSSLAASTQTVSTILSTIASWERRVQEWEFARALALQDTAIGDQQIRLARDRVRVVNQERQIARMQTEHAQDVVDFLATKFTNVDLYDFMADQLQRVYNYFLQQATAMAQMAYDQLAFERQQEPPPFIRSDYWEAPSENALGPSEDGAAPDRRGLTGSARLLHDIVQLDEYAFETDRRKHQLVSSLSLARLMPTEFMRFKETGELRFTITPEMFDRQFPGHYLRLIKRVRVSVVALIPPSTGIRATLARTGPSFTVVGGQTFQRVRIAPTGAELALSSPYDDTGVFQLDVQPEMRGMFESEGLEGGWVLRMPRPANPFDFDTIADVIVTFEYTALSSDEHRRQVIQALDPTIQADRAFSFRTQFADQWYDLKNPDETATPMTVTFRTERDHFPPNLDDAEIRQVVLLLATRRGTPLPAPVTIDDLRLDGVGGAAVTTLNGLASSRTNAASWVQLVGKAPLGEWTLALPDDQATRELFSERVIDDILFVITFSGQTPAWV
jgi:hypothetical protein